MNCYKFYINTKKIKEGYIHENIDELTDFDDFFYDKGDSYYLYANTNSKKIATIFQRTRNPEMFKCIKTKEETNLEFELSLIDLKTRSKKDFCSIEKITLPITIKEEETIKLGLTEILFNAFIANDRASIILEQFFQMAKPPIQKALKALHLFELLYIDGLDIDPASPTTCLNFDLDELGLLVRYFKDTF